MEQCPDSLCLLAGKGAYPLILAQSAKKEGVRRLFVIAFRKETDRAIEKYADEVAWIYLGQLRRMLDAIRDSGVKHAVMAGQITPTHLFRVRMDAMMLSMLRPLPERNAETIFGAVANELTEMGVHLMPASTFMDSHMPGPGILSERGPTERELADAQMGFKVAATTSDLDVGQTVVIKEGTILAVEAFDGTDETIARAGRLGGKGIVVVKVAKPNHDMRFDIPVIGMRTMKLLKKVKAAALAIQAGRAILLEREKIIVAANAMGLCLFAVEREE